MQIIGFNLTKISVEREEKLNGKLDVKQNVNIENIIEDNVSISKDKIIKITFIFSIKYGEDLAKIEFKGMVIVLPKPEELSTIIKDWKEKKFNNSFRVPLFNFIMNKCNVKALALEDEMALPLHIPMPKLAPKPD